MELKEEATAQGRKVRRQCPQVEPPTGAARQVHRAGLGAIAVSALE